MVFRNFNLFTRVFVISLIIFGLMFLSSCSSNDVAGNYIELSYPSKFAGPKIVSVDVLPRSTVAENSDFFLVMTIENQGSQDMREASVRVFGYDKWYVEIQDVDPESFEILAYDEDSPVVLSQEIEIEGFANLLSSQEPNHEVTLFIESEFKYSTVLDQAVCISPSGYDVYGGCDNPEIDSEITANSQYSPVAITTFQENVFEREQIVYFDFHIENKGSGEVGTISLKDAKLTTDDLQNCDFEGEGESEKIDSVVRYEFVEDEKSIDLKCEYRYGALSSAITKSLYLELVYDYSALSEQKFTIEPSRRR
ncbi:hypothetical protein HOC01_05765 [archaeon]|jgi:hypothetical protein|nr:hypothetical protein [archaeon]MBT6697652.1 hypothetical protein [archaeon]